MGAYEHYLSHHGIKGQKWGERRFQNEDGTLTAEGKERYLKNIEKLKNVKEKAKNEYKESKKQSRQNYFNSSADPKRKRKLAEYQFAKEDFKRSKIEYKMANGSLKNSKRFKNLQEKYIREGLGAENATIAAYRRTKTERALEIGGAVTLAAAATAIALTRKRPDVKAFIDNKKVRDARIINTDDVYKYKVSRMLEPIKKKVNRTRTARKIAGTVFSPVTIVGAAGASAAASSIARKRAAKQRDTLQIWKRDIAAYKHEHPNTNLSDREILRNIYGKK